MGIISVREVCKVFKGKDCNVHALDKASLEVNEGELVVIYGMSGSGKATLLKTIGSLLKPDTGSVNVCGKEIYKISDRERADIRNRDIGFVYQDYRLINEYTVKENIELPFAIAGEKCDREKLEKLLEYLGISGKLESFPDRLSGGEQQRVSLARALIREPKIILADEPTGNLDSCNAVRIMEYIKEINQAYETTIIVVTHDDRWKKYAARVCRMEQGRLYEDEINRNDCEICPEK